MHHGSLYHIETTEPGFLMKKWYHLFLYMFLSFFYGIGFTRMLKKSADSLNNHNKTWNVKNNSSSHKRGRIWKIIYIWNFHNENHGNTGFQSSFYLFFICACPERRKKVQQCEKNHWVNELLYFKIYVFSMSISFRTIPEGLTCSLTD